MDCKTTKDSRQPRLNPVSTRPTALGSPTDCNRTPSVDPEVALFCNPPHEPTKNIGTPILPAIATIELNYDEIAEAPGIARIAPKSCAIHNRRPERGDFQAIHIAITIQLHNRNAILSQFDSIRLCQDANSDHNRHNQIELQRDFKTTKDRQGIQRIAPKIHKLQANIPNCPRIGLTSRSVEDQSAIHPKSVQCCQILLQSRGLWWDCRFEAIPWQSCFNPQQSNFPSHGTGQP